MYKKTLLAVIIICLMYTGLALAVTKVETPTDPNQPKGSLVFEIKDNGRTVLSIIQICEQGLRVWIYTDPDTQKISKVTIGNCSQ